MVQQQKREEALKARVNRFDSVPQACVGSVCGVQALPGLVLLPFARALVVSLVRFARFPCIKCLMAYGRDSYGFPRRPDGLAYHGSLIYGDPGPGPKAPNGS